MDDTRIARAVQLQMAVNDLVAAAIGDKPCNATNERSFHQLEAAEVFGRSTLKYLQQVDAAPKVSA